MPLLDIEFLMISLHCHQWSCCSFASRPVWGHVSLVGAGMRSQAGVASKAFKALSENNVNIQIICTSEIKITMVIDEALVDKAVNVLHEEFELER